jgi:hypothetical protein
VSSKQISHSADFPGDDSYISGEPEDLQPGMIINPNADEAGLLSGAVHRLDNALDILWLLLDRANDCGDDRLQGAIVSMGRLCNEARALNLSLIERVNHKAPVTTLKKVREVPG